ncbi:serine protease htrA-like protein [Striga asiatica]|uniref:Serine protease htrA-like protein n=1 Tax=Striga asiatica TaxID=4170 RepID=A0A5A7R1N4_STRAF|nr:serine protease htrA-like protein [Striga asiatica]
MELPYTLWRRSREEPYDASEPTQNFYSFENTFERPFETFEFNKFVDTHAKEAALRVSPCIVSLISYSGEEKFFWASGVIVECDNVDGFFECTILTSASLLRINAYDKSLAKNLKVEVILPGGSSCLGDVISVDWHFNISAIRIQSPAPLPTAKLRCLDDAIQTHDLSRPQLQRHSSLFKLLPGDDFIALGRYHSGSYYLMVAPGKFRLVKPKASLWTISTGIPIDRCELDCKELLRVNCMITKCGIGGAMVNLYGEVVGINFYAKEFTPFLPMNVVCKWWDHVKSGRKYSRTWLGMKVIKLFSAEMNELRKILVKFPNISEGIFVEEVTLKSPAALAGVCPNDVIVQFGGQNVKSCLELFGITWDKVGEKMSVSVLRASTGAREDVFMVVGKVKNRRWNRWLVPPVNWWKSYPNDMRSDVMDKANVWRINPSSIDENQGYHIMKDSFKTSFNSLYWNQDLDIYVKRIANKAAPSVVSLQVSSGGNEIFGSGFVIECDTVITSASLLNFLDTQSGDLKVCVGLCDGEKCDGVIVACDFHYNLAAIKIKAGKPLQIARLKYLDDSICIDPTNLSIGKLHEMHSDLFRIFPGERVIALGRFIGDIGDIMVSPGEFSVEQCRLDCKELLRSTGRITQCGIGGPMINRKAEVAPNSPAGSVNVQPNDIIVECDGVAITSNLQFFDLIWHKTGNMVKLGLARTSDGSRENLSVMVADASPTQFNRWPIFGHTQVYL